MGRLGPQEKQESSAFAEGMSMDKGVKRMCC